jgi:hypothetical protein
MTRRTPRPRGAGREHIRASPLLAALFLAAACGATAPEPEHGEPSRCTATCDEVALRGPLAATAIDGSRVLVVARSLDGRVLVGEATVDDGRWDPASLRFRALDAGEEPPLQPDEPVALDALADAHHLATTRDERGLLAAWADDDGVHVARVAADGRLDSRRTVDDGTRDGEPAHRIGASLALIGGAAPLVAYQDQTDGTLVVADLDPRTPPRTFRSPDRTRAMHVALVRLRGGPAFALDLAAVPGPRARYELLATRIR